MFWSKVACFASICLVVTIQGDDFKKCGRVDYACKDSSCSLTDASYRGGYICDEFPFYAGGFPRFKVNVISGECLSYGNSTSSSYTCQEWSTIEDDEEYKTPSLLDGDDYNNCKCMKMDIDNMYCMNWICIEGTTNEDWININNNNEYNNCTCSSISSNGNYCSKWYCEEYENNQLDEVSGYWCTSDLPSAGKYCWSWEGRSSDNEEFEVQSCQCMGENDCNTWYCYKKEMSYWHSLFCLSVGLFGTIGLLIPLCRISRLYCRRWCQSRGCCSYYNNNSRCGGRNDYNNCEKKCGSGNSCNKNQTVTVNSEGNEVYTNATVTISSTPNDPMINNDGCKTAGGDDECKKNDAKCGNGYNYSGKCNGYGYYNSQCGNGNSNGNCGYGSSGCGYHCCGKLYVMLIFASLVTGGLGALIVNLCMWLFGMLLSCYLWKRYYCCYSKCNRNNGTSGATTSGCKRRCNRGACGGSSNSSSNGNCSMKKKCCGGNSDSSNGNVESNCESKKCCKDSGDGSYQELAKTDV